MATRALEPGNEFLSGLDGHTSTAPEIRSMAVCWDAAQSAEFVAKWDALVQRTTEPNPFFESWYLLPSLRNFDPGHRVRLFCLEANGEIAGIMPLSFESKYYGKPIPHWRGWSHPNSFLGTPLVARGFESAFWQHLGEWLDREAGSGLFLHLSELPLQGRLCGALGKVLVAQDRSAAIVHSYDRAFLKSDLTPAEYYEQSVNKKRRKEYRRREKRLGEQGNLIVERLEDDSGIEAWIDEFLELESSGWKGEAGSALASSPETEALFRETMRTSAARGRLERLTMRLDGRPVAILTSFLTVPGAFGFKTAYDETFRSFSPGVHLQRSFLDILEREEIEWCDSCAAEDHPMIDHFWRERRPIGRVNLAVGGRMRRALFKTIARLETGAFPKGLQ